MCKTGQRCTGKVKDLQVEMLLRVLIAGFCGVIIGYERKSRLKEAGIRTHFVVAVGSALMMIISKYAFQDQIGWDNLSLDPSRIAAGVVSGVGFLGAGMIFMQRQTIKGLTTAAGIWATAGIGMAVGAGLYFIGVGVTLILFLGQVLLHGRIPWLTSPKAEKIRLVLDDEKDATQRLLDSLKEYSLPIVAFSTERQNSEIHLEITIKITKAVPVEQLLGTISVLPFVKSMELD